MKGALLVWGSLVVWTGCGLLLLGITAAFARRERIRFLRAARISGTIVSYEAVDGDDVTVFYPRLRGNRPSGESFEFESPSSRSRPAPAPGSLVEILVDPDRPERLWIAGDQWRSHGIPNALLILIGVAFGAFVFLTGLAMTAAAAFAQWRSP